MHIGSERLQELNDIPHIVIEVEQSFRQRDDTSVTVGRGTGEVLLGTSALGDPLVNGIADKIAARIGGQPIVVEDGWAIRAWSWFPDGTRALVAQGWGALADAAALRARLGAAVAPKEIEFVATLPRTRSGKIMRRLLKARELGLPEGDTSTLESGG